MNEQSNIPTPEQMRERVDAIRQRIVSAARKVGRDPDSITLVAVTKTFPPAHLEALFSVGHRAVGENRVQELKDKYDRFGNRGEWHFIGHLQRNKIKDVIGRVDLLHTVDSVRLIEELERKCAQENRSVRVLLEINVGEEEVKTGADAGELPAMLKALEAAPHVKAEGLMTIPPFTDDPELARPFYQRLRTLMEQIPSGAPFEPKHLSMGMSRDFEIAIEEGATIVRVGEAIMGTRLKSH